MALSCLPPKASDLTFVTTCGKQLDILEFACVEFIPCSADCPKKHINIGCLCHHPMRPFNGKRPRSRRGRLWNLPQNINVALLLEQWHVLSLCKISALDPMCHPSPTALVHPLAPNGICPCCSSDNRHLLQHEHGIVSAILLHQCAPFMAQIKS